ncbi:hypothetical protein VTL71DRAFT_13534 [Oculimacula yallundae]|uniref:Uncharacterized protein n=1 Tax=Oculimacula yallundae TaxID=86028 RepID=A0ABR4CMM9_9HELO
MSQLPGSQEEEEIAPLEYARRNGLAQDYLVSKLGYEQLTNIQSRLAIEVDDETNLLQFDLGPEFKVEERLPCSQGGASLLSWATREEDPYEINAIVAPLFKESNRIRKQKLELPLLQTDVDTDCRNFAGREGFEIRIEHIKLPLEAIVDGEGFDWTEQYENLGAEVLRDLRVEKLGVTKAAMTFIQACAAVSWTEEDDSQLWAREQKYKRRTILDPITPPLSPLPQNPQPFEPSSSDPTFQVPIFSDPISPTKQDLEAIEREIFKQDMPTPLRSSASYTHEGLSEEMPAALQDIFSSLGGLEQAQSPETRPAKWEHVKVEVPLMAIEPASIPKTVRFNEHIEFSFIEPTSSPVAPDDGSAFFEDTFQEAYTRVNKEMEHEKLNSENITARVDVPELDLDKADAPWKRFEEVQSQAALSALQKSFVLDMIASSSVPHWPGSGQQQTKLPWAPFSSSFAKLALEDDALVDDTTWKALIEDDGDVIDSSSLTWKPAGLKILTDEEDEEDIDFGQFPNDTPQTLSTIVKKRKRELQERENSKSNTNDETLSKSRLSLPRNTTATLTAGEEFGLLGGAFSAQASLNNYLELQGVKRPKLAESSYFTKPEADAVRDKPEKHAPQTLDLPIRKSPALNQKLPVPTLQPLTAPTWIIVSTTLLKNRPMIKSIEAQLSSVTLIERDFTAHNTTSWMPGSVSRSPIKSPLDAEADIIVSPSVGIILTTLQKIKQKPLMDKMKPQIRERLDKVSLRYEKVILLISEGNADDMTAGLTDGDCLAFAEFAGYIAGLEASISMHFIGGGAETLSRWITSSIIQNRLDTELLADETYWELFLRRAGLNAFAAQAVISILKAPDGVDAGSPSKIGHFGLTAFVEMGTQERIARFGSICGHRVLSRVSAVLDAKWQ